MNGNDAPATATRVVFALEIVYLAILLGAFVVFEMSSGFRDALPDRLGPLPVEVPWFGALGGTLISLTGIYQHSCNWSNCYRYWHYSRPLVGAVIGSLGALVFFVLSDTASAGTTAINVTTFDVVAFLVGYREQSFRELIERVTDLVLKPAEPLPPGDLPGTASVVDPAGPPAAATVQEHSAAPETDRPSPEGDATTHKEATPEKPGGMQ